MDGEARILDNADDDVIQDLGVSDRGDSKTFTITGTDLDNVTAADGVVTLKVVCQSLALVQSTPDTSRSVYIDTTAPPALTDITGTTGTVASGDIILTIDYPVDTTDYNNVKIRRKSGATAPTIALMAWKQNRSLLHLTTDRLLMALARQSVTTYSYRVCIYDLVGNLTFSDTESNIKAYDITARRSFPCSTATRARYLMVTYI